MCYGFHLAIRFLQQQPFLAIFHGSNARHDTNLPLDLAAAETAPVALSVPQING